jgi:hypothetical protein
MMCLRRRPDHLHVIAVIEHLASPPPLAIPEHSIDVLRGRDHEPLHPLRQRRPVLGLDDHVHVIPLQADMHDPQPLAHRRRDRGLA